ncbi:MAG: CoA transferase [Alphaproteobacteria bacterium]|nr:CoA transferase [Alphaproteobacteria bacterium]MCB9927967.1 CoA transferase [Alphaproteobacteria bacterium]
MASILDGITVADFTAGVAGPAATQMLGDLGATVIKVEPPGGDPVRAWPGPRLTNGDSAAFLALNRNKRSLVLDLATESGQRAARTLAGRADVAVIDSPDEAMAALGLGADALRAAAPRLIHAAIDPTLPDGSVGRDALHQAASGWGAISGLPEGPPAKSGLPMMELTAANSLVQAILAALIAREESGTGQAVSVGLFRNALAMTYFYGMNYRISGDPPTRHGNSSPAAAPIGVFQASDGPLQMTLGGERVWRKFVDAIVHRADWLDDPRYATNSARVQNKAALVAEIEQAFATQPRDQWVEAMRGAGVPGGPIRTIGEAVDSPEVRERGLVGTAPHTAAGEIPVVLNPIRFAATPVRSPQGAPLLGEHTAAIATEFGLALD